MDDFPRFLRELDPTIYTKSKYVVLDFETTNKDFGSALHPDNRVIYWVCYCSDSGLAGNTREGFTVCGTANQRDIQRLLALVKEATFVVAHNAKFELQWLYRLGLPVGETLIYDTMLGEYCIAGNRKMPLDLDSVAKRYSVPTKHSVVKSLIGAGICPSIIPEKRLTDYCMQDVQITHSVFLQQRKVLAESGLLPVMFTRCLTTLVLADIEKNGIHLDPERVNEAYKEVTQEIREAEADLHTFTGGINPRSAPQKATYLYDDLEFEELKDYNNEPKRTDGGAKCTDADTIGLLVARTEKQKQFKRLFLRFNRVMKKAETITKFKKCVEEDGGIIYANFNQAVTRNHRLSSTGKKYKVQLQNIDRDFKRLFSPRNAGWYLSDPDAPQLEFRVAGHLTGDPQVIDDVRTGYDVHKFTASVILKKAIDAILDKDRADNKPHTFKPVYGGQSGTPDEKRYYQAFNKKYSVMHAGQKAWTYEVLKNKCLRTCTGLVFHWPHVKVYDSGYVKHTPEIFNYPVSSLAGADIMLITLVYLWYLMKIQGLKAFIVNTVHDSHPIEHPIEETEQVWNCAQLAFTTLTYTYLKTIYGITMKVPLGVDMKSGLHWGESAPGMKFKYKGELGLYGELSNELVV